MSYHMRDGIKDDLREIETLREALALALPFVEEDEWRTRNAAENQYCPSCPSDPNDDGWGDQKEHRAGCSWVAAVEKIRAALVLR